jgi:hypothetical protein
MASKVMDLESETTRRFPHSGKYYLHFLPGVVELLPSNFPSACLCKDNAKRYPGSHDLGAVIQTPRCGSRHNSGYRRRRQWFLFPKSPKPETHLQQDPPSSSGYH